MQMNRVWLNGSAPSALISLANSGTNSIPRRRVLRSGRTELHWASPARSAAAPVATAAAYRPALLRRSGSPPQFRSRFRLDRHSGTDGGACPGGRASAAVRPLGDRPVVRELVRPFDAECAPAPISIGAAALDVRLQDLNHESFRNRDQPGMPVPPGDFGQLNVRHGPRPDRRARVFRPLRSLSVRPPARTPAKASPRSCACWMP